MTSEVMTCTTDGSPKSRRNAFPSAFPIRAVFWPPYAIIPLSVCPVCDVAVLWPNGGMD